ncbi:MAG: aspartyl protease family protein [Planctomycetes bacterium]|nr:aspartyl protease family protein [Planctomycetota bacterium]
MNAISKFLLLAGFALLPTLTVAEEKPAKTAEEAKKLDEKPITVPFELLKSRHMAVMVKINGKGPYKLIFDTGAPTNLINNRLAKDAGVMKKDEKGGMMFGLGGAKTMDTLQIGDVKLEKVPVMVMDHPTVTAISNALGPIDGIIGFPFFAKYKTTVDYQKKELTFTPNGYVPGDAMQGLMDKLMKGSKGKPEPGVAAPAGVWGFTVDKATNDDDAGVVVKEVFAGSAAFDGGLRANDRLLTLDGRWTDSIADTFTAASLVKAGRAAEVVVKRDGKEVKLTIKPAKGL